MLSIEPVGTTALAKTKVRKIKANATAIIIGIQNSIVSWSLLFGLLFFDENSIFTVSTYLKGEYGEKGIYIGVPSVVNRNGIREILEIELNEEEQKKFNETAKIIHEMVDEIEL